MKAKIYCNGSEVQGEFDTGYFTITTTSQVDVDYNVKYTLKVRGRFGWYKFADVTVTAAKVGAGKGIVIYQLKNK